MYYKTIKLNKQGKHVHVIKETNKIFSLVILNNIWQRFRKMMINSITFLTLYATNLRYMSCRRNDTYLSEIMIYELGIFLPFLWHIFWFYNYEFIEHILTYIYRFILLNKSTNQLFFRLKYKIRKNAHSNYRKYFFCQCCHHKKKFNFVKESK